MSKIIILNKEDFKNIILYNSKNLQEKEYELFCQTFNDKYDYSSITDMSYLFSGLSNLKKLPDLDTSKVTDMSGMFYGCNVLKEVPFLNNTSKVIDMENMFHSCYFIKEIPQIDVSKVKNMNKMFYNCENLKKIHFKNVSKLENVHLMFKECLKLTSVRFEKCNNLYNMKSMFEECKELKYYKIIGLNKSKKINLDFSFKNCKKIRNKLNIIKENIYSDFETYDGCDLLEKIENHKKLKEKNLEKKNKEILKQKKIKMYEELNQKKQTNELSF